MKNSLKEKLKKQIGSQLRALRGEMSQGEMAKFLQVTQSYLCQVEQGKKIPSLEMLIYFAKKLNIPVSVLLGETMDDKQNFNNTAPIDTILNYNDEDHSADKLSSDFIDLFVTGETGTSIEILLSLARNKLRQQNRSLQKADIELIKSMMSLLQSEIDSIDG